MRYRLSYFAATGLVLAIAVATTISPAGASFCDWTVCSATPTPRLGVLAPALEAVAWEQDEYVYEVKVYSGLNLIAFPSEPIDPSIESIMADSDVDTVFAYRLGQWETAVADDGEWSGGLTEMHGGIGYWVDAQTEHTIAVALSTSAEPPALEYYSQWNLLGVWDARLRPHGTRVDSTDVLMREPSGEPVSDLRNYVVAYGVDSAARRWHRVLRNDPDNSDQFRVGHGYWVWVRGVGCCPFE